MATRPNMSRRKQSNPKAVIRSQEEDDQANSFTAPGHHIRNSNGISTQFPPQSASESAPFASMTESTSPLSSPHADATQSSSSSTTTSASLCHSPGVRSMAPHNPSHLSSSISPVDLKAMRSLPVDHQHRSDDDLLRLSASSSSSPPQPSDVVQIKMELDDDYGDETDGKLDARQSPPNASAYPMPMLRLNTDLASDPALQPDARDIHHSASLRRTATTSDDERNATADDDDSRESSHHDRIADNTANQQPAVNQSSVLLSELTRVCSPAVVPPAQPAVSAMGPRGSQLIRHGPTAMYVCEPCGIKFSSLSTLEAHQTYYCTQNATKTPVPSAAGAASSAVSNASGSTDDNASRNARKADNAPVPGADSPAAAGHRRPAKLYACTHCTYSADKKVSLNRHMRMHQTSPISVPAAAAQQQLQPAAAAVLNGDSERPSVEAILAAAAQAVAAQQQHMQPSPGAGAAAVAAAMLADRYCSDCDIKFSNAKTFWAHKQHYCSGRQRNDPAAPSPAATNAPAVRPAIAQPAAKSRSQSPQNIGSATGTPPASHIGGAQTPSGVAQSAAQVPPQPYLALPTNPIVIIPYAMIRGASIIPGPLTTLMPNINNAEQSCYVFTNGKLQPIAQAAHLSSGVPATSAGLDATALVSPGQQQQQQPLRCATPPATTPQTRRSPAAPAANHTSSSGNHSCATTPRGSVRKRDASNRATTTPLDLSVQRLAEYAQPSHRDRSGSFSSTQSGDDPSVLSHNAASDGKENIDSRPSSSSQLSSSPEHIVCAPSMPASPTGADSPPKRPSATSAGGQPPSADVLAMILRLWPPEMTARLSDPNTLERQKFEMALRYSAAALDATPPAGSLVGLLHQLPPPLAPILNAPPAALPPKRLAAGPPIIVKQGDFKCIECNIVFSLHDTYVAHKTHYCTARGEPGDAPASAPAASDVRPATPPPPAAAQPTAMGAGPALAYQPRICAACGTKFTSLDNLNAHQTYYCSKRLEQQQQIILQHQQQQQHSTVAHKCAKCKTGHDANVPCGCDALAYHCPLCEASAATAAECWRHLETHGVKGFCCTFCRYRGNTLRGMRTHVRMHFDKQAAKDYCEEHYITCIVESSGREVAPLPATGAPTAEAPLPPPEPVQRPIGAEPPASIKGFRCTICQYRGNTWRGMRTHVRMHPERGAKDGNEEQYIACILDGGDRPDDETTAKAIGVAEVEPNGAATTTPLYSCEQCNYASSFRGNVVRHTKLVHANGGSAPGGLVFGEGGECLTVSVNIKAEPVESSRCGEIVPVAPDLPPDDDIGAYTPPYKRIKREQPDEPAVAVADDEDDDVGRVRNDSATTDVAPMDCSAAQATVKAQEAALANYCAMCDIRFSYDKTFLAHKQFYCKAATQEPPPLLLTDEPMSVVVASPGAPVTNVSPQPATPVL